MARLTIIVAFPLMRHTERLWRRRTGATRASREPERLASARIATNLRVLIAKADQPPSVSTANGKKTDSLFLTVFLVFRKFAVLSNFQGLLAEGTSGRPKFKFYSRLWTLLYLNS